jgi:hypothetical protein
MLFLYLLWPQNIFIVNLIIYKFISTVIRNVHEIIRQQPPPPPSKASLGTQVLTT